MPSGSFASSEDFIEKGKIALNSIELNEVSLHQQNVQRLASLLVDSMPLTSSEELVILIERFSCEEISEIELRSGIIDVIGLHTEFIEDLMSFLEISLSKSIKVRVQTSAIRTTKLLSMFAEQVDELIKLGMRSRESANLSLVEKNSDEEILKRAEIFKESDQSRRLSLNYCFKLNLVCRRVCRTLLSRESDKKRNDEFSIESEAYDDVSDQVPFEKFKPETSMDVSSNSDLKLKLINSARRKVFVGNLPREINVEKLVDSFRSIGKVIKSSVFVFHYDNIDDKSTIHNKAASVSTDREVHAVKGLSVVEEVSRELPEDDGIHYLEPNDTEPEVRTQTFFHPEPMISQKSARNPLATFAEIDVLSSRHLKRKKLAQVSNCLANIKRSFL